VTADNRSESSPTSSWSASVVKGIPAIRIDGNAFVFPLHQDGTIPVHPLQVRIGA
jgi:hypothetical protein